MIFLSHVCFLVELHENFSRICIPEVVCWNINIKAYAISLILPIWRNVRLDIVIGYSERVEFSLYREIYPPWIDFFFHLEVIKWHSVAAFTFISLNS